MSDELPNARLLNWVQLRKITQALTSRSLYLPILSQIGVVGFVLVPDANLPPFVGFYASLAVAALIISERILNFYYPTLLVADSKKYFTELADYMKSVQSALNNMNEIEVGWKTRMLERLDKIQQIDQVKSQLTSIVGTSRVFPELSAYKEYFDQICDPVKQNQLNLSQPAARFFCALFMAIGVFFSILCFSSIVHEVWFSES